MSRKFLVPVVLPADPVAAMEAATKQYVDQRVGGVGVQSGSYTPALADIGVGNGSNTAYYVYVGGVNIGEIGIMQATGTLVFGASGSVFPTGFPAIGLPSGFDFWGTSYNGPPMGRASYDDVSVAQVWEGELIRHGGANNWMLPRLSSVNATYSLQGGIANTLPFVWAAGDRLLWHVNTGVIRTA